MVGEIEIIISRTHESDEGTFGIMHMPLFDFRCTTLELPDRANKPMRGRILAGKYRAVWCYSKRFKRDLYRLEDRHGRVGILIHPANFAGDVDMGFQSELSGCIGLGHTRRALTNRFGKEQMAVDQSISIVTQFEHLMRGLSLMIEVNDVPRAEHEPRECDEPGCTQDCNSTACPHSLA
ncbi:MAG: DUF5675 family protein [Gallionellaceae bacterium]|jgi:hypothetical protein